MRRAYGLKRVGHGGTLDPAVTGVLPIAVGPATRLLPYLEGDKAYRAVVQLGVSTSSDDLEGTVLGGSSWPEALARADLEQALEPFRGAILQRPPAVSAVHVQGERAYVRARRGESVELEPRPVRIGLLELLAWDPECGQLELEVRCSAGTYIRALARDLGGALGCGAALARLRRTEALGFNLAAAVTLEELQASEPPPLLDPLLALGHLHQRRLLPEELVGWRCGRSLAAQPDSAPPDPASADPASPDPDSADPASADPASPDPAPGASGPAAGSPCAASPPPAPSEAVAVLDPDGRLAGIAQVVPGGLIRPRLVFDAAG